jgi:hypothetical protein
MNFTKIIWLQFIDIKWKLFVIISFKFNSDDQDKLKDKLKILFYSIPTGPRDNSSRDASQEPQLFDKFCFQISLSKEIVKETVPQNRKKINC